MVDTERSPPDWRLASRVCSSSASRNFTLQRGRGREVGGCVELVGGAEAATAGAHVLGLCPAPGKAVQRHTCLIPWPGSAAASNKVVRRALHSLHEPCRRWLNCLAM